MIWSDLMKNYRKNIFIFSRYINYKISLKRKKNSIYEWSVVLCYPPKKILMLFWYPSLYFFGSCCPCGNGEKSWHVYTWLYFYFYFFFWKTPVLVRFKLIRIDFIKYYSIYILLLQFIIINCIVTAVVITEW